MKESLTWGESRQRSRSYLWSRSCRKISSGEWSWLLGASRDQTSSMPADLPCTLGRTKHFPRQASPPSRTFSRTIPPTSRACHRSPFPSSTSGSQTWWNPLLWRHHQTPPFPIPRTPHHSHGGWGAFRSYRAHQRLTNTSEGIAEWTGVSGTVNEVFSHMGPIEQWLTKERTYQLPGRLLDLFVALMVLSLVDLLSQLLQFIVSTLGFNIHIEGGRIVSLKVVAAHRSGRLFLLLGKRGKPAIFWVGQSWQTISINLKGELK